MASFKASYIILQLRPTRMCTLTKAHTVRCLSTSIRPFGSFTLFQPFQPLNSSKIQCRPFSDVSSSSATNDPNVDVPPPSTALTPYQKVTATARNGMYLGLWILGLSCGYFIVRELLPTRMNPNSLFNEAVDELKTNSEVVARLGAPIKGYGKDFGGHREGRRNFIEHVELTDKKDGEKRLRIKFNLKGSYGHAYGYGEAKKKMKRGEWIYLIVQCTKTGETIIVHDNRQLLQAESSEEEKALRQLLGNN